MTFERTKPRDTTGITPKQWEVMLLSAIGLSEAQISKRLCRSSPTIQSHRRNILEKTGHANFVTLAVDAYRQGLTEFRDGKLCIASNPPEASK